MEGDATEAGPTRAGYVALIGRPNAGKSTLLNALVGERLSIVTAKAQTTWRKVTGILTTETCQIVFQDTPGLLEPGDLMQRALVAQAREALRDADLLLVVLDATRSLGDAPRARLAEAVNESPAPRVVAVNKVDAATEAAVDAELAWARSHLGVEGIRTSGLRGDGREALLERIESLLPESPFLHPPDELAVEPVRFFVAELVRETVFESYRQEVPYAVLPRVEEYRSQGDRTYIQVTLFVERASQKGILIGDRGSAIRELGRASREKIEHFLGEPVYLDLWVKVLPGWRKKRAALRRMGFSVPEDDAHR